MKKSLNKNLLLTAIKTIASTIFPLITFPYVTKVLSPDGIGIYNYTNSLISYFALVAALGFSTYAIREGAKIRENKDRFEAFASEIFTLNILFTAIAYVLLGICFLVSSEFRNYSYALLIWSISILFETLGVGWIFGIYEDYLYITIRSLVIQVVSLICLFLFVRDEADVYWYIAINVLSNVGMNVYGYFYVRRYARFRIVLTKSIWKHILPVIIIFSTSLSTKIYVTSDNTMLGWMCNTEEVGYYSVACKMYNILKSIINSFVPVFMARLSCEYSRNKEEYGKTFQYGFELITLITIPLAVGSLFFSDQIILLLSDASYLKAETGMKLLFISMIFATLGNLYSSGGLLQAGKEKYMLIATSIGAFINIALNIVFIQLWKSTGAAWTTLITEVVIFAILYSCYRKKVGIKVGYKHVMKCCLATVPFGVIKYLGYILSLETVIQQLILIIVCVLVYFGVLCLLRDKVVCDLLNVLKKGLNKVRE